MWSSAFWKDAAERAVKTAAQSAVGFFGSVAVFSDLSEHWDEALLGIGIATALSLLTSVAGATRPGTISPASFVKEDAVQ